MIYIKVEVKTSGFSDTQMDKILLAVEGLHTILTQTSFWVTLAAFRSQRGEAKFTDCLNSTQGVAIDLREKFKDCSIALKPYKTWNPFSSVIGYYEAGTIYVNMRKFDRMAVADLSQHIAHEMCHHFGYTHSYKRSVTRDDSLPYAFGRLVAMWGK